jgi:hypothetical protein
MREEAIRFQPAQRKANEERRAAEENAFQVEKDVATKVLAEEQRRRHVEARALLAKHQGERAKAVEVEGQRQHLLHEQELRRDETLAQQHRASAETAKNIHAELANEKQANRTAPIDKNITPPHQHTPLVPGLSTARANLLKPDFGNMSTTNLGPGGIKNTGAHANFPSDSRLFTTSPKVGHVDPHSTNLLSDPIPPITVFQATDPNSSKQPGHVTPIQHQSASANGVVCSSNSSTTHLEHNSWVTPPTTPGPLANHQTTVCIGSDTGNVPLIPRSLVPPISPEVQKVNLRRLIIANGSPISPSPNIKRDPDEEKKQNSKEPTNDLSTTSTSNIPIAFLEL